MSSAHPSFFSVRRRLLLPLLALISTPAVIACGGGGDDDGDSSTDAFASYAGIYEITSYELTEGSCDSGSDALGTLTEQYMVAYIQSFLGVKLLTLASCSDVADCEDKKAAVDSGDFIGAAQIISLDTQVSEDELSGFVATSGSDFMTEGTCSGRTYTDYHLVRESAGELVLDAQEKSLQDTPTDEEGFCVADPQAQRAEAADAPCTEREVFTLVAVE